MIFVTGCAGFIGFHMCRKLLEDGYTVLGVDNMSDYYDVSLKRARLDILLAHKNFTYRKNDISNKEAMTILGQDFNDITHIIHLAAQAGVRYSLINPYTYVQTNVMGQLCMLELARSLPHLKHMIYASTSSVYGANEKMPFSITDRTDTPISLYAATKKSCEVMSESYARMYQLPLTGLRYFTVYGPWGRPDMALFMFTRAILNDEEIPVFNNGNMQRNFSYIDDIVAGTLHCVLSPRDNGTHKLYNIGNNKSETLMDYIQTLEMVVGKKAKIRFEPMQNGDVKETIADISETIADFAFAPQTDIKDGVPNFVNWYRQYYNV